MKKYKVYFEEYMGDDHEEFDAVSFEDAAEKFADYYDSQGDYTVVNGNDITVQVEDDMGTRVPVKVTGETVANYIAIEIEKDGGDNAKL